MNRTRSESYNEAVREVKSNSDVDINDIIAIFLTEIAGSIAVIADAITEKKSGDTE